MPRIPGSFLPAPNSHFVDLNDALILHPVAWPDLQSVLSQRGLISESESLVTGSARACTHNSDQIAAVAVMDATTSVATTSPSFAAPLVQERAERSTAEQALDRGMPEPEFKAASIALVPLKSNLYVGDAATGDNFGVNFLFNRDHLSLKTYSDAIAELGATTLRYPGGTISESTFDLKDPNGDHQSYYEGGPTFDPDGPGPQKQSTMGLWDFMDYCAEQHVSMSFVMPTARWIGTTRDAEGNRWAAVDVDLVYDFTLQMLEEARARGVVITAIELGNEWWIDNSSIWGENLSAVEYGRIASSLAVVIQSAIDDFETLHHLPSSWNEPQIVVQVGPSGKAEWVTPTGEDPPPGYDGPLVEATRLIFEEFNTAAEQAAVDGVVLHDYTSGGFENINGYRYEAFDLWDELASSDPDFQELDRHVSEWNIKNGNSEGLTGLKQASGMIAMMSEMLIAGVDYANAWPVQQTTNNALSLNTGDPSQSLQGLSAGGEAYRLMAESLPGLRAIPLKDPSARFDVTAFGDDDKVVLFLASTTGSDTQIDLGVDALVDDYTHVWGTKISAGSADPLSPDLVPVIINLSASQIMADGQISVSLKPYEVMRIEFTLTDVGVSMNGSDRSDELTGSNEGDIIVGEKGPDSLKGLDGSDEISGSDGSDLLQGGSSNDDLTGGSGGDSLYGDSGADRLEGGSGNDRLFGGSDEAADMLIGGSGSDMLYGGSGNDRLDGGDQNDSLTGGDGADTFYGGNGVDQISADQGADRGWGGTGNDVIRGGSADDQMYGEEGCDDIRGEHGNDRLSGGLDVDSIGGGEGNDSIWGDSGADLLRGGTGNDAIYGGDHGDVIDGWDGADRLYGGAWSDTVYGGNGADQIDGGNDADFLFGGSGDERATGGQGDDQIWGDTGSDRLSGNQGNDRLYGGAGADTFVFDRAGRDVISDFEKAADTILFEGFDGSWNRSDYMTHATQNGGDVLFDFGQSSLLVENTTLADVSRMLAFD